MRKSRIATEVDIRNMDSLGQTTLSFGGGLQLRAHASGYKYFQFRFRLDGRDNTVQLGRYPEITLAQAQEKAAPFRAKVADLRVDKAEAAFQRCIASSGQQRASRDAFRCVDDARLFMQRLNSSVDSGEAERALWLQIHLLLRSHELRLLRWEEFDSARGVWAPKTGAHSVVYLSGTVISRLGVMHGPRRESDYLFPALAGMTNRPFLGTLAGSVASLWPEYDVDVNMVSRFFQVTAGKRSYFRSELIQDMIARRSSSGLHMNDEMSYVIQRRALAEWWSAQITPLFGNF